MKEQENSMWTEEVLTDDIIYEHMKDTYQREVDVCKSIIKKLFVNDMTILRKEDETLISDFIFFKQAVKVLINTFDVSLIGTNLDEKEREYITELQRKANEHSFQMKNYEKTINEHRKNWERKQNILSVLSQEDREFLIKELAPKL